MRADTATFHSYNVAPQKSPRFVVAIIFDVGSIYITSHTGITTVPGIVLDGHLKEPSAISQRIVPDEGRSEIGSMSFTLIDKDSSFTNEARSKLNAGKGLRGKEVRLYVGYEGLDFTQFQRFQTQVISDVEYDEGVYRIQCRDITREQRKEIFEPKKTTLRDSISATATTVPVYVTTGFSTVFHGPSYSDAPNATVGYVIIDDEVIRYTGKTADSFTGCTRGVLNSRAVAHEVDAGTTMDRRPKVEEYIYLELPAAKLAYAILTGVIYNDSATLPSHWHLGIATTWVRLSDFTGIGADLWDTMLDTSGFVARFTGLKKTDGKKFLESELYMLLGCYSPVYSDGTIGLKRMNHVLADAPSVVELNEKNCVSWSALKHEMDGMHNQFRVDWNWDGEDFTRRNEFIDAASVAAYGTAPVKELKFKGLHGARHTDAIVRNRIDALRDRYTWPPVTQSITILPSLNRLEVGDIPRVNLPTVRDFAGSGQQINRSVEIQQMRMDFASGNVSINVFGSTGKAQVSAPTTAASALPDAYYTAAGTNLTSVCTIVPVGGVGVIQPGTYNLTGNADLNNAGAIYYYAGDLELADGATLTINNNVQLRVRGFFTINGDIDGVGRGHAGVASSGGVQAVNPGTPGYVGNSRGMDGVRREVGARNSNVRRTVPCALTKGQKDAFDRIELAVSGNSLLGLPSDLRGTSGGGGGKLIYANSNDPSAGSVIAQGGTGGNSGAGLAIISRGLAPGASSAIDLSGADSAATSEADLNGNKAYPGAGGAGGPGALFIGLDGAGISLPDLGGKFIAQTGDVPVNGDPISGTVANPNIDNPPYAGYLDPAMISGQNLSNAAHRIQYIPETQTPAQDVEKLPPAPTSLSVSPGQHENVLIIGMPPAGTFDVIEIYAAILNDRAGAVLVDSVGGSTYRHQLSGGVTRFYWVRARRGAAVSAWFPSSSTGGISGTTYARFIARGNCQVIGDVARKVGGSAAWDSDVYSPDQYNNGCFVTFRPAQTTHFLMVGLNSDPTTDQSYSSLDYAFYCRGDATGLQIYESGTPVLTIGAYTTSTVLTISHDGKLIKYFVGGALVRQVPVTNATLFMDSSFSDPGAQVSALQFGPLNAVTPSPWVARGNCVAGVTTARKSGGTSAWDSDVYSIDSYPICHLKFKPSQTDAHVLVGLNTDPTTDQVYTSVDFAWYPQSGGALSIHEGGVSQGVFGSYTTSTELAITYDGSNVRYYKDRVLVRTVASASQTFFADSSFYSPGAAVDSLHFGPGTSLEAVGTPGIEPNAATDPAVTVTPSDGSQAYSAATQIIIEGSGLSAVASYTAPVAFPTQVDVDWSGQARISNATSGTAVGEARITVTVVINGSTVFTKYLGLERYTGGSTDWGIFSGGRTFAVPAGQTIDVFLSTQRTFSSGGSSPAQTMFWRSATINLVPHKK